MVKSDKVRSQSPTRPLGEESGDPGIPRPAVAPFVAATQGRYQYLSAIGSGGMASVHSARDLSLQRTLAVKVLDPSLAGRAAEISRFVREAQVTAQLEHPGIVPVHELGTDTLGNPYFTMKRVDGRTLTDWIAEEGHPPSAEVLHQLMLAYLKICDAVAFAHSRGVLHCDLKPDNIMIGSFGQVYVMDWGLALVRPSQLEGGVVLAGPAADNSFVHTARCGTPAFMAPEQAAGAPLGEATDIFGLGAILFAIVTGAAPYEHDDNLKAMTAAEDWAVTFPRFGAEAPVLMRLTHIMRRAMAREPLARFGSVAELRGQVEAAVRGLGYPALIFAPGTRILAEGQPGDCAYVIVRGTCVAYRIVNGQRVILHRLTAGSVFGETAILTDGVRTASVDAEDEVVVQVVSRQLFQDNVDMNTPFGSVVTAQADRFRELDAASRTGAAPPDAPPSGGNPETGRQR